MKKITLTIILLLFTFSLASCGLIGGQTTTKEDPTETTTVNYDDFIEINTVDELQAIEMNKSYRLMNNLDLTDVEWTPLGTSSDSYKGNFDGNGYEIINLSITTDNLYNGLFGYVEGNIYDLKVINAFINIDADFITYAGFIAGYSNGDITGCRTSGMMQVENEDFASYLGLVVGFTQGKLDDTTLVDEFEPNLIDDNYVHGEIELIEGELGFVGGIAGKTYNTTVSNNVSLVDLDVTTGTYPVYIGGLIGHNYGGLLKPFSDLVDDVNIYIENNITASTINVAVTNSDVSVGGFIGYNMKGYNRDNYVESNIDVTEETTSVTNDYVIKIGGYFGEGWESQVEDVIINTTADLTTPDTTSNYATGALAGEDYLEFEPIRVYLVTPSSFSSGDLLTGSESELLVSSFYTTLGWPIDFLDILP
ncbi:lipoprotein [Candidatus Izemoplasma sp. B36]|uniref:LptM family lipoprotein n=1 Tax=Candidatus Izemoplasma sp. B36 TaxID=3242468 RepID=UPI0035584DAA